MNASFVGISRFYTGLTSDFVFGSVPITFDENYFLIGVVMSCSIDLHPVLPSGWNLVSQIENVVATGTTIIASFQPTGTTTNPVLGIGGLSNNLNTAFILLFSGCTKNQDKIINFDEHKSNPAGDTSSSMRSIKSNSLGVRIICLFSGTSITHWDCDPALTWSEISDSSKVLGSYANSIGIAIKNNLDTGTYSLSNDL